MSKINFKNIAILTSRESWFVPHSRELVKILKRKGYKAMLFFDHKNIGVNFPIVFILSYFKIINEEFLKRHKYNLVVHESDLPKGRGWAPLFWQILEGKHKIPVVLFEAVAGADRGDIYIKDNICLKGDELHDEIRKAQAEKTIEMCLEFLGNYKNLKPVKQKGKPSYYPRRTPKDSKLDTNKSLKEQFNFLRIANNEEFPTFFSYRGHKYIIKIFQSPEEKK